MTHDEVQEDEARLLQPDEESDSASQVRLSSSTDEPRIDAPRSTLRNKAV